MEEVKINIMNNQRILFGALVVFLGTIISRVLLYVVSIFNPKHFIVVHPSVVITFIITVIVFIFLLYK